MENTNRVRVGCRDGLHKQEHHCRLSQARWLSLQEESICSQLVHPSLYVNINDMLCALCAPTGGGGWGHLCLRPGCSRGSSLHGRQ
jgi:hypothetical protein